MRIQGPNATARVTTPSTTRRAAAGGFSIAEEQETKATAPAASLRTIGGIDALLALQGDRDPAERRRRAVYRGRNALDMLDALKVDVLSGTLGPATLMRLKSATVDLMDASGDTCAWRSRSPRWPRANAALSRIPAVCSRNSLPQFRACRHPARPL
jgi:hypothetical protein